MVNRIALAGLMVIFAAGAWLVAAPFAVRFQPAGVPWTGAARTWLTSKVTNQGLYPGGGVRSRRTPRAGPPRRTAP